MYLSYFLDLLYEVLVYSFLLRVALWHSATAAGIVAQFHLAACKLVHHQHLVFVPVDVVRNRSFSFQMRNFFLNHELNSLLLKTVFLTVIQAWLAVSQQLVHHFRTALLLELVYKLTKYFLSLLKLQLFRKKSGLAYAISALGS